jgi:hypothetical protein
LRPKCCLNVERGTRLVVRGNGEPEGKSPLGVIRRNEEGQTFVDPSRKLTLSDGEARLGAPPAEYVLEVFASWAQGDGVFTFGIRIKPGA